MQPYVLCGFSLCVITFFPLSFINIYHYFKIKKTVCEQNQK